MSNKKRAAEVINKHGFDPCSEPECIAQDLADAGLLAPDLPEPDECPPDIHTPGWNLGTKYAGVLAGRVWVTDERGWGHPHTPDEIRTAAHKLLAAANAAEEEKR